MTTPPPPVTLTRSEEALLVPLDLFPNTKERSESMSVWAAVAHTLAPFLGDGPVTLASIGDGTRPRTAALCAVLGGSMLPLWRFASVDPILCTDSASNLAWLPVGGEARGDGALLRSVCAWRAALPGLACVRAPVQRVRLHASRNGERVVLVLMHAHVSLRDAVACVEPRGALAAVLTCPCCCWEPLQRELWGRAPDAEYADPALLSDKNLVRVWLRREGDVDEDVGGSAGAVAAVLRAGRECGVAHERAAWGSWAAVGKNGPAAAFARGACSVDSEVASALVVVAGSDASGVLAALVRATSCADNLAPAKTWSFRPLRGHVFAACGAPTRELKKDSGGLFPPLSGPLLAVVAVVSRARKQRTQCFYSLTALANSPLVGTPAVCDELHRLVDSHAARESVTGRDRHRDSEGSAGGAGGSVAPHKPARAPRIIDLIAEGGVSKPFAPPAAMQLLQACLPRRGHSGETRLPPVCGTAAPLLEALAEGDVVLLVGALGLLDTGVASTRAPTPTLFVTDGALLYSAHWRVEGARRDVVWQPFTAAAGPQGPS